MFKSKPKSLIIALGVGRKPGDDDSAENDPSDSDNTRAAEGSTDLRLADPIEYPRVYCPGLQDVSPDLQIGDWVTLKAKVVDLVAGQNGGTDLDLECRSLEPEMKGPGGPSTHDAVNAAFKDAENNLR